MLRAMRAETVRALVTAVGLVLLATGSVAADPTSVDSTSGGSASADPDTLALWITPEAAADSLDAFWTDVDDAWLLPVDATLTDFGLDGAALDSLAIVGHEKLADMMAGRAWRFSLNKLHSAGFNRVQGPYLGMGARLQQLQQYGTDLRLSGGYGFSSKRPYYEARTRLTLLKAQRRLKYESGRGRPWPLLSLHLDGGKRVRTFGGEATLPGGFVGLVSGQGPYHYFEDRGGGMQVHLRPKPQLRLSGGFLYAQQRPLRMGTDWNLLGQSLDPADNLQIPALNTFAYTTNLFWSWRGLSGSGSLQWHELSNSPLLVGYGDPADPGAHPGYLDMRRLELSVEADLLEAHGNRVLLRGNWLSHDRQAPLHWKAFLGGYKTLRGYPEMTLAGDRAAWASLDVRLGFDLLKATRLPLLKSLGLQPIVFTDWGRTWTVDGPAAAFGAEGWRANAGFGFGKMLLAPGIRGNLRVYAAHQVFDGMGDEPWRFVIALEN